MIEGQHLFGLILRGRDFSKEPKNGYLFYNVVCPYCENLFSATIYQIKPKSGRKQGKDHCGCQSRLRRATRIGVPPSNKLDDLTRTVNAVIQSYKAGAKTRGLLFELSFDFVAEIIFKCCYYCGQTPNHKRPIGQGEWTRLSIDTNGIDRIDSSLGYVESNVVPCCTDCNYFKVDRDYSEFLIKIKKIYENLGLGDINESRRHC